jgi:hypothetical protein
MTVTFERHAGVDTDVALDFMGEILARLDRADLAAMTAALEAKSAWVRKMISGPGRPGDPADRMALMLLRSFFPSRRRARDMVAALGGPALLAALDDLVAAGPLDARLEAFGAALHPFEDVVVDLGWEVLHVHDPTRYWPWTRWMWNPKTETGALRLVTADDVDLWGDTPVGTYHQVGAALAVVHQTVRALGLVEDSPFGLDVFLANVYGVYMYTVLRMRMSQEFNRIVPELPSLARRLLGIHDPLWEETRCP